jgi:prepilin-type processing-associated H-X9-DG protein
MYIFKAIYNNFSMFLMIATVLSMPVFAGIQESVGSRHPGGVNVALGDGSVRFVSDSINVTVWKIYLPNSPLEYDYVDARDPNAETKARALFDAAYRLRSGVVISVSQGELDAPVSASTVKILVNDGGDRRVLAIKLKEVYVTSWQTSASGGDRPMEMLALNFTKIEYVN